VTNFAWRSPPTRSAGAAAVQLPGSVDSPVGSPEFLACLRADVPRFAHHEHAVTGKLAADSDYVALCHWNANVDNAWFWRDADHVLHCGLMDWGCAGKMNVAMALWGATSGAETDLWDQYFDDLLRLFVSEVRARGGPKLDACELQNQVMLYVGIMTVAWLLDVPALIYSRFGMPPPRWTGWMRASKTTRVFGRRCRCSLMRLISGKYRHFGDLLDAALY
jgi:hypothetical protein